MTIDLRIKQLSYSSLLSLHRCPRKFQLYKLNGKDEGEEDGDSSVTFAYGHVVGAGIQDVLEEKSEQEILFNAFKGWHAELFDFIQKNNKSFWTAVGAIKNFIAMRKAGYLKDYELVYYQGKPAVELSFLIKLPNGFVCRGFVDAVLRHKITGEILVLECKTTGSTRLHPAMYKNSAQAIGYSIVLDALFKELSSYKVLYLVYKSTEMEFEQMEFAKSYLQRALWIQELLLDVQTIEMYEACGVYPMHGESCYDYFRQCERFDTCTLSTQYLTSPITDEQITKIAEENAKYQIQVDVLDLIQAQLEKQ